MKYRQWLNINRSRLASTCTENAVDGGVTFITSTEVAAGCVVAVVACAAQRDVALVNVCKLKKIPYYHHFTYYFCMMQHHYTH